MKDYPEFKRDYLCIVKQMRSNRELDLGEAMRLTEALIQLMESHPAQWTERVENLGANR